MASHSSESTQIADSGGPDVRLEVRQGGRATTYEIGDAGFLIGTVAGCDLRLPNTDLPPVLCLFTKQPNGVTLRKLAPTSPVILNGKPTTHTALLHGDRVTLGAVELLVQISGARLAVSRTPQPTRPPAPDLEENTRRRELDQRAAELDARERKLHEQTTDLEADRVLWYQRRAEIEQEIANAQRLASRPLSSADLTQLAQTNPELADKAQLLATREADVERQRQELSKMRQELADIRRQLYDRYQERRDRLAGLQQAVTKAAQKVQEQKRRLETDGHEAAARRQADEQRQAELEARAHEVAELVRKLDQDRQAFEKLKQEHDGDTEAVLADLRSREDSLLKEKQELARRVKQHEADVLRLDRIQGTLEERESRIQEREEELNRRLEQLEHDGGDLEEQAAQLDALQKKLAVDREQLQSDKAEYELVATQLAQRAGSLEGQQATLAALRTRLERMRDEVRLEEQQLAEQRARQEEREAELERLLEESAQRRALLESEDKTRAEERQQLSERAAVLDAAVVQLRQAQEKLAADEERLRVREAELESRAVMQVEESSLVKAQLTQLEEAQKRIEAERHALQERTQALAQAEQVRSGLQEQLRKRNEDLVAKQKAVAEQTTQLQAQRSEAEELRRQIEAELAMRTQQLESDRADFDRRQRELVVREEEVAADAEKVAEAVRRVEAARQALAQEHDAVNAEKIKAQQEKLQVAAEFESIRTRAAELLHQLPDAELRAGSTLERVTHARDQLKEHLAQVHAYAQECQDDLEKIREQVQADAARLLDRAQTLRKSEDEHRLAVAAFRQQLIDWQGQVADMKRSLATDETRLERKQAYVEKQAQKVGATTEKLAKQAESLQEKEQSVLGRRLEVDRHLADMRQWYRHKLRELAGGTEEKAERAVLSTEYSVPSTSQPDAERTILSLPSTIDDADRKLGQLLQSLELVEATTLDTLLSEAHRRRTSLRQILLTGGTVTLYQMALIEAGRFDSLMLGPVRVIDRLRSTPRETVYRVFDPRLGHEAVLRHLSETETAEHQEEFRQSSRHGPLSHPHVAENYELLDIAGRPAVLQELVAGLPATEWPPLAAVAGVCFRLLTQAGLGLGALHQAGRTHGCLSEGSLVLDAEGTLKICGAGEPAWLNAERGARSGERSTQADLKALGKIAAGWCSPNSIRRGAKAKPFPDSFLAVVERLGAETGGFNSAGELLEELDRISADVPPNAEAWDRLLRHVREHSSQTALRKSA